MSRLASLVSRSASTLVGLPGLVAAGWLAAVILARLFAPSLVDGTTMTLSEAAAMADQADVIRMLGEGADPNTPSRVRAPLLGPRERVLTPIEAVIAGSGGNRKGTFTLLVKAGVSIAPDQAAALWCLARNDENRALLTSWLTGAPPDCH